MKTIPKGTKKLKRCEAGNTCSQTKCQGIYPHESALHFPCEKYCVRVGFRVLDPDKFKY